LTTYQRVVGLLSDGKWHHQRDLFTVSAYPKEWIKELDRQGLIEFAQSRPGDPQVRLRPRTGAAA
jgi:hypothetical protein